MHRWTLVAALVALLVAGGCATKTYVQSEVGAAESRLGDRVNEVQGQVEANQNQLKEHGEQISSLSKTAQEALDRAKAAGKLAEGKFLYEVVLTDNDVKFGFDKSNLSDEAQAALNDFAAKVKSENKDVYIEIQGHCDSIGTDDYNYGLGLRRAESVRNYLAKEAGFALHRMSVISYGESEPIADNNTRDGRAQNRRVALVVLE